MSNGCYFHLVVDWWLIVDRSAKGGGGGGRGGAATANHHHHHHAYTEPRSHTATSQLRQLLYNLLRSKLKRHSGLIACGDTFAACAAFRLGQQHSSSDRPDLARRNHLEVVPKP